MLRLAAGWDRDDVARIARDAIEEVIEPIVYAEALELIAEHQAAGRPVYLVSASPTEIVEPLAEHLGVDGCLATHRRGRAPTAATPAGSCGTATGPRRSSP